MNENKNSCIKKIGLVFTLIVISVFFLFGFSKSKSENIKTLYSQGENVYCKADTSVFNLIEYWGPCSKKLFILNEKNSVMLEDKFIRNEGKEKVKEYLIEDCYSEEKEFIDSKGQDKNEKMRGEFHQGATFFCEIPIGEFIKINKENSIILNEDDIFLKKIGDYQNRKWDFNECQERSFNELFFFEGREK